MTEPGLVPPKTDAFSLPPPPSALIITADDFGFGVATSRGIIRAHQAGVVTSTSLMVVTGDHAAASVQLLADAPSLEVGLHMVLSGPPQKPLVARPASGLVDRDGCFHSLPKLLYRAWRGKLDRAAVFDEICAQAARFRKLLGRAPAYVDGHHHAHQLPVVREALIDAIRAGILPRVTRLTIEPPAVRRNVRVAKIRRFVMNRLGEAARAPLAAAGVTTNDFIFGMIEPKQLHDASPWAAYLPHLPASGVVEWFVHPGEPDESLVGRDTYLRERAGELQFFLRLADHPAWPAWRCALTTKAGDRISPSSGTPGEGWRGGSAQPALDRTGVITRVNPHPNPPPEYRRRG